MSASVVVFGFLGGSAQMLRWQGGLVVCFFCTLASCNCEQHQQLGPAEGSEAEMTVLFVNGGLTSVSSYSRSESFVEERLRPYFPNAKIQGFYNSTNGFFGDLWEIILQIEAAEDGSLFLGTAADAQELRDRIITAYDPNKLLMLVGHSQGTSLIREALLILEEEEQREIASSSIVVMLGSPLPSYSLDGYRVLWITNCGDILAAGDTPCWCLPTEHPARHSLEAYLSGAALNYLVTEVSSVVRDFE